MFKGWYSPAVETGIIQKQYWYGLKIDILLKKGDNISNTDHTKVKERSKTKSPQT